MESWSASKGISPVGLAFCSRAKVQVIDFPSHHPWNGNFLWFVFVQGVGVRVSCVKFFFWGGGGWGLCVCLVNAYNLFNSMQHLYVILVFRAWNHCGSFWWVDIVYAFLWGGRGGMMFLLVVKNLLLPSFILVMDENHMELCWTLSS